MRGNGAGANKSWHWGLCSPMVFAELMDPVSIALKEEVAKGQLVHIVGCALELLKRGFKEMD